MYTVGPAARVSEAVETLEREKIGAVLVVSGSGEPLGILSERDVIHGLRQSGPSALERPVSDLMTRPLVTCGPESGSESVMEQMLESRIRHLPVMREGALLGIISIGDVMNQVVAELKWMKAALRDQVVRSAAWSTEED